MLDFTEMTLTLLINEGATSKAALKPLITDKTSSMNNFFFTISDGKFLRIDLNQLVCGISMEDYAQLHTETGLHKPNLTLQLMKALLKEDQFIWINDRIALSRRYADSHR